jgi:hypothetical protein
MVRSAGAPDGERAFTLIVDAADPTVDGAPTTVVLWVEGLAPLSGRLSTNARVSP